MKPADEIRQLFRNAELGIDSDADEKVFEDVFGAHKETTENVPAMPEIWRVIMKSPLTKITATAVVVLAAYLSLQIPRGLVAPAYALQDTIEAYNSIGDIMRYTPTFGMENGFVYRSVAMLGSALYAGNFNGIGNQKGYGGDGNTETGDAPGLIMWGLGAKGTFGKWSYKVQYMDFSFDEEPDHIVSGIDDEVGQEFDLRVTYAFSKHFSMSNCFAAFDPGDGVQDRLGSNFDDTALVNTIELIWKW